MPNKQYERGVRFERERKRFWESLGYQVTRASGSHGFYDLVAIPKDNDGPVYAIQCKTADDYKVARKLASDFKKNPPLPRGRVKQTMEVKVMGRLQRFIIEVV